ncbi:MAG TPA: carbon storage regulator [Gemmataceae bacterium]|jgi:carbon storage regulator|nr:carbon storage regulator [Gemmataceae bacterium]
MLVLSRRKGEEVVVPGYGVRITVLEVKGSSIRLGIAAPREVGIFRGELLPEATPVAGPAAGADSETD